MTREWRHGQYTISTDKARLDFTAIHDYLSSRSYWAAGVPMEIVRRSVENSLAFGVYHENRQVGFARVITDYATFGYLADVFILEEFRGQGLSKWLMEVITSHPELQGFRRWVLATRDAHGLYRQYGFAELAWPESLMEKIQPDLYAKVQGGRDEGVKG